MQSRQGQVKLWSTETAQEVALLRPLLDYLGTKNVRLIGPADANTPSSSPGI